MLPRFKSLLILTFLMLSLYAVFYQNTPFTSGHHPVDVWTGSFGDFDVPWRKAVPSDQGSGQSAETRLPGAGEGTINILPTASPTRAASPAYFSFLPEKPAAAVANAKNTDIGQRPSDAEEPSNPPPAAGASNDYSSASLQVQFNKEYQELELNNDTGAIFGNTLKSLVDAGTHEGFAAAALKPSEATTSYSDSTLYTYNPYPEYNSVSWQAGNQGVYKACMGPNGPIPDLQVYSGHPKVFSAPQLGSYIPLDIDSNLCFERETRLGPYGYVAGATPQTPAQAHNPATDELRLEARDAARTDWGKLQQICYKINVNRYTNSKARLPARPPLAPTKADIPVRNATRKGRLNPMTRRFDMLVKRLLAIRQGIDDRFPEAGPSMGESEAVGSLENLPELPQKVEDLPPSTALGGFSAPKSPAADGGVQVSGGEKYNKAGSSNPVPQLSKMPTDVPVSNGSPMEVNHSNPPGSVKDQDVKENSQHEDSRLAALDGSEANQDLNLEPPKFASLPENTQTVPGLSEDEGKAQGLHGMPANPTIKPTPRTAVIIRMHSNLRFTEDDEQNIRAMVSELCLRSGGEYEIFLLVEWKDETLPIFSDKKLYKEAVAKSVPQEFASMTVLWNNGKMRELYPLIPAEANNVQQSHWLAIQYFAQEHPGFGFYWNWEFDTRYIGHHYNLLEKLSTFAKAQPRKGLWERNERFYLPSYHGRYSKFIKTVERDTENNTVWGAPQVVNVNYIGSSPPVHDPKDDNYVWGVGEDADYISLNPIFDPINTGFPAKNDVWGYDGPDHTPRRATIGTQSRCSKKLLDTMHAENKKGNHVSSEMTPQTVSLLHGLKAVYAPIPIYFDRSWSGESLQRYFNPGPGGESGSSEESPFSRGREGRFLGSTWHFRAMSPQRLHSNWLGLEYGGSGGLEWERVNGKICLPPLLLHPIRNTERVPADGSLKSGLAS